MTGDLFKVTRTHKSGAGLRAQILYSNSPLTSTVKAQTLRASADTSAIHGGLLPVHTDSSTRDEGSARPERKRLSTCRRDEGESAKGPESGSREASEESAQNFSGINLCQKKVGLHPCFQKYQYFNVHLEGKESN